MSEREVYEQLKQMAINEAIAGFGKESIARNVGAQIDKIIDLALTLSANRQGYKLVPTTPTMKVYDRLFAEHDLDEDRVTYIYKDIMDAVGN